MTADRANIARAVKSGGIVIHIVNKALTPDSFATDGRPAFYTNQTTLRKKPSAAEPTKATVLQANVASRLPIELPMALLLAFFPVCSPREHTTNI